LNKNLIIVILLLVIGGCIVIKIASNSFHGLDYKFITSKQSSSKQYTVFEFESTSEASHAPYGRELVLTKKNSINFPEEGYLIFAGYCKSLEYSWKTNSSIQVLCENNKIITQAKKAYDINIEVLTTKTQDIITKRRSQ